MKNAKVDHFFNLNISKDKFSNNIKLFQNKNTNNTLLKISNESTNEHSNQLLKNGNRPLSTAHYSNNNKEYNIKKINEFIKQNINNNINRVNNHNICTVNLKSIIDSFNTNNFYKLVNFHQKINGKNLEEFIIKNIISLPKIKEKNKFLIGKNPISFFNQNQENKNLAQKNKSKHLPNYIIEKENKALFYKDNKSNNIKNNIMVLSNSQNTKILRYLINKNNLYNSKEANKSHIKNENSYTKKDNENKYYNNTMNSVIFQAISNNKLSNTNSNFNNNSLIFSYQQPSNSSNENKVKNKCVINCNYLNIKDLENINNENIKLIKSNDNFNFKNNNINNSINLRATYAPVNNIKQNYDINNNYFLKEEFLEKLNNVRKIYKEREVKRQNLKCFYYLILPGNASYLVEKCMNHRINWMKPFSIVTTLYNFKWQELSYGIDYSSLGHFQNVKQIVNHYENHFVISNKAKMFTNLLNYCEKRKISAFKYVPFTIVFQLKDEKTKKIENEKSKANNNNANNNNDSNTNENEKENKYEKLKEFMNNIEKYVMNYNKLGKYYDEESYKKYIKSIKQKEKEKINKNINNKDYKRLTLKRKYRSLRKIIKRKHLSFIPGHKKDSISELNGNKDNSNYAFYSNFFNNLIEDNKVPIYDKNKDKNEVEDNSEQNIIGSNTIIEIPESHFSGKNMWVIKAINLNRGMCIRIVNTYEQMLKILNKFKEGVDYNFTKEKIDENEKISQIKNITNNNNSASPSKRIKYKNNIDKEKLIKKNITSNILNSADKAKNINANNSLEKSSKPKAEEDKKINEKEEKLYNCNKIIIQKYIENPLLYNGRKCDMRIWVLLTHLMKVYVFKEGHLKTCSIEYNINSKDAFAHITNYSFQKYNSNFQKYEKGNEVPFYEFQKFLDENYSERKYNIKIDLLNQIKEIVKITMRSAKDKINKNDRNFQFEIYGYDFMMDKDFNLFLIEINTNPGLEESSPWIKLIVPRMLDDALRLTIDQLFETKYDFSIINKNKTNEEINNYKKILNNFNKNIDINGINVSSSINIKSAINKIDNPNIQEEIKDNYPYLKTIPTLQEKNFDTEKEENTIDNNNDNDNNENNNNNENNKHINEKQDNNNNQNKEKKNINKIKKYVSPFPIPGYTLDENIWDFVCDLNELDPLDERIDKEEETLIDNKNNKNSYNKMKRRKNKKGKKRKIKLKKISDEIVENNEDRDEYKE